MSVFGKKTLFIHHEFKSIDVPIPLIRKTALDIYSAEKVDAKMQTHVIMCSDAAIKKLNRQFRDKDKATDVLSFNYDEPDLLGEIYISLERARSQAKEYHVSFEAEIKRLFVHGMFHLLGYDHKKPSDAKKMQAKERPYFLS